MTAVMPERTALDLDALRTDLAAVLAAHGITGADVTVSEIVQDDAFAGVTVSATAYERPSHLPTAEECGPDAGPSPWARLAVQLGGRPSLRLVKGDAR